MPEKHHEPPHYLPTPENCVWDKVINKIWHHLRKALEVFSDKTAFVPHDLKCSKKMSFVEDEDSLTLEIFYNAEEYSVKDFSWGVFVDVQFLHPKDGLIRSSTDWPPSSTSSSCSKHAVISAFESTGFPAVLFQRAFPSSRRQSIMAVVAASQTPDWLTVFLTFSILSESMES